jgi:quercetin dioxygenase-like cupin family protein
MQHIGGNAATALGNRWKSQEARVWSNGEIARRYRLESHSIFYLIANFADPSMRAAPIVVPRHMDRKNTMNKQKILVIAAAISGAVSFLPNVASAGQCPADKISADATKPNAAAAKGVSDTVLAAIDLAQEPTQIADRMLRLRKLVVQPNGVVPWHSHGDRPAIIYVVAGTITEYASNCAVPIVHKAGEVARETSATSHWWKNTGRTAVTLLSADVQHDAHDHNM